MFSTIQSDALAKVIWAVPGDDVGYIDAFQRTDPSSPPPDLQTGFFPESDLEDWLQQKRAFAPSSRLRPPSGGIRLLFLERMSFRPPSFPISQQSYVRIAQHFHLAPATLSILSSDAGLHARFLEYDASNGSKLKRLRIVIKTSQKFQVGNYGLSYCHDFETGLTTGIIHGTNLFNHESEPFSNVIAFLESIPHLWTHPLSLPIAILQPYISHLEYYCRIELDHQVLGIQQRLGTSRAGRLHHWQTPFKDPIGDNLIHEARENLQSLTSKMSTCMCELIYFSKIPEWVGNCTDFLLKTLDEIQPARQSRRQENDSVSDSVRRREIEECLEYLRAASISVGTTLKGSKDVINAEFNVLYSHISQVDNRLNAKMAASTSRDSTAMKALAGITAVFLPSTAVATIFSMSMFNWQSDASSDGATGQQTVSHRFWIYWVVSIPLTILVGIVLKLWWTYEKRNFDRDILNEIEGIDKMAEQGRQDGQQMAKQRFRKDNGR